MSFNPTNKQIQAIENMEIFCQIKTHRNAFENKKEFDNYFSLLQKKGKNRSKLLDSLSSGEKTFTEIEKNKREKKEKHYSNYDTLRNYGVNYINRYYPTYKKLEIALIKKNTKKELALQVAQDLSYMIDENKMIKSVVSNLKSRGKNIKYITNKLYAKKFDVGIINDTLLSLREEGSLLNEDILERKIINLMNKGKSKNQIRMLLVERNQDIAIVDELLINIFGEFGENDILKEKIEDLKRKNISNDKIISRLITKGFKYGDINELI